MQVTLPANLRSMATGFACPWTPAKHWNKPVIQFSSSGSAKWPASAGWLGCPGTETQLVYYDFTEAVEVARVK